MPADNEREPLVKANYIQGTDKVDWDRDIKYRHYVICPVIMCYFAARGINFYVVSQWIQFYVKTEVFRNVSTATAQDGCQTRNHSDPAYQMYEHVQETTASWNMYKTLPSAVCCLLVSAVLPSYSDSIGRRFLFLLGFVGAVLNYVISAAVIYFKLSIWILVAACFIESMLGSEYALLSATSAFVSDLTRPGKWRTIGITAIDALLLTTVTVTGFAVGFIIQQKGFFFAEACAVGFSILGLVPLLCFLPETHEEHRRSNVRNVVANFKRTFSFYGSIKFRGKRTTYLLLIGAFILSEMTNNQRTSIEMLYQLGMPFCWTNEMIGIFSSIRHAAQGIVGMMLAPPLKMCLSEVTIAILSSLFNSASYIVEGLATSDLTMYLVSVPAVLGFLGIPMIKSVMSIITPGDKQGSLFASIVTSQATCSLVNGFLLNFVYRSTVTFFNGFVFLMLAGVCGLSFLILVIFAFTQKVEPAKLTIEKQIQRESDT